MNETVGQQLQQARLARGATLEDASQATHIRPRFLQALEADDPGSLPSVVQGRGFLRLYADFLGLDTQRLLDEYAGKPAIPEPSPARMQASVPVQPPVPATPTTPPAPLPGKAEPQEVPGETLAAGAELESPAPEPFPVIAPVAVEETAAPVEPTVETPKERAQALFGRSQAIFDALGADLRAQRELLSLTLNDVERYTRLRVHYLQALEEGRMQDLPSPVQGRGMLANYARFLNLDAEAFLLRFADALQSRREGLVALQAQPAPSRHAARVVAHPTLRRVFSIDVLVTGGLIFLLIGFIIWGASQVLSRGSANGKTTSTPPSLSDVLLSTPSVAAGLVETTTATGEAVASAETGTTPEAPVAMETVPSAGEGAVQVYVVAQQRAWMRVTIDGKVKFSGRIVPGSAYPYSGDEQIEILTGNAAGLSIVYNAQNIGVLGAAGEVVDVIFTQTGMIAPTPAATLTPAATPTSEQTAASTLAPEQSGTPAAPAP